MLHKKIECVSRNCRDSLFFLKSHSVLLTSFFIFKQVNLFVFVCPFCGLKTLEITLNKFNSESSKRNNYLNQISKGDWREREREELKMYNRKG